MSKHPINDALLEGQIIREPVGDEQGYWAGAPGWFWDELAAAQQETQSERRRLSTGQRQLSRTAAYRDMTPSTLKREVNSIKADALYEQEQLERALERERARQLARRTFSERSGILNAPLHVTAPAWGSHCRVVCSADR